MTVRNESHPECSDTVDRYVVINPPLPQVDLGPDIEGCMPLEVEFPSTTKYIYEDSYQWDFGYQGMTSTEQYPSFHCLRYRRYLYGKAYRRGRRRLKLGLQASYRVPETDTSALLLLLTR